MHSITAPALKRPGTVSHTLVIRHTARRVARRLGIAAVSIEEAAVRAYRESTDERCAGDVLCRAVDSARVATGGHTA